MTHTHRTSRMVAFTAGVGIVIGSFFVSQPAFAAVHESEPMSDGAAIELAWADGAPVSATESFVGMPVAVPGDRAERTIKVKNVGPGPAVLYADIREVSLLAPGAPDVHHNPGHEAPNLSGEYQGAGDQGNFYDDVSLTWDGGRASFTELADAGITDIAEVPVERGETVELTLSYDFPAESTSGNGANVAPREATFDVVFSLSGDTEEIWPSKPLPEKPSPGGTTGQEHGLANTGGTQLNLLLVGATVLVGAGGSLVVARRKHAQRDEVA